jgi:putative ABC transport system substrate-binding protein
MRDSGLRSLATLTAPVAATGVLASWAVLAAVGCGSDVRRSTPGDLEARVVRTAPEPGRTYRVGFSQIVDHPALDATRNGFVEGLRRAGFVEGRNLVFEYQSAQGDVGNARVIAQQFLAARVDLMAPCTTSNAQAALQLARGTRVPVVFGCITDPVSAGVLEAIDRPSGTNVTGMYHPVPIEELFELYLKIRPGLKAVGTIYNASETNSQVLAGSARAEAERLGLEWVEATVTSTADVRAAADSLAGRVEAFVITQDNTVASAFEAVVGVARSRKIPIFAMDVLSVERGAIATLAIDQFASGVQWATELAAPVLLGADPGTLLPVRPHAYELHVNPEAARAAGVTVPPDILSRARTPGGGGR